MIRPRFKGLNRARRKAGHQKTSDNEATEGVSSRTLHGCAVGVDTDIAL